MKRISAILLTLALLLCAIPMGAVPAVSAAEPAVGVGAGTEADPYLIGSAAVLANTAEWSNKAYVKLTDNISMNGVAYTAPDAFSGVLDGDGYAITNLSVNVTATDDNFKIYNGTGGFVDRLNSTGVIKNLALVNYTVTATNATEPTYDQFHAGMLVGAAENGSKIQNVYIEGNAIGQDTKTRIGVAYPYTAVGNASIENLVFVGGYRDCAHFSFPAALSNVATITDCYAVLYDGLKNNISWTPANAFDQTTNLYVTGYLMNEKINSQTGKTYGELAADGFFESIGDTTVAVSEKHLFDADAMGFSAEEWLSFDNRTPVQKVFEGNSAVYPLDLDFTVLGANIRCAPVDPKFGLRFVTEVNMGDFLADFGVDATHPYDYGTMGEELYFGTLFLPLDMLPMNGELNFQTAKALNIVAEKTVSKNNSVTFRTVVTNFPQDAQNKPIVARSYVRYRVDGAGDWKTVFCDQIVRTYMGVASQAYVSNLESDAFKSKLETEFTAQKLQNYGLRINGNSLKDYRIVISKNADSALAETAYRLQIALAEKCGVVLPVVTDKTAPVAHEIYLGASNRTYYMASPALEDAVYGVDGDAMYLLAGHYYGLTCSVDALFLAIEEVTELPDDFCGTLEDVSDVPLTWNGGGSLAAGTYTLVWNDEFSSNVLNPEKWRFNGTMYVANVENLTDASVARVENGTLIMNTDIVGDWVKGSTENRYKTSYGVTTYQTMNFTGGYLEMRAKVPFHGKGEWPSFWATSSGSHLFDNAYLKNHGITPREEVGYTVEVDFFEVFSDENTVVPNLHKWFTSSIKETYKNVPDRVQLSGIDAGADVSGTRSYDFSSNAVAKDWHLYGFLWTPDLMAFSVDGEFYYAYSLRDEDQTRFNPTYMLQEGEGSRTFGMDGYDYDHLALGIILNNQMFSEAYGASAGGSWAATSAAELDPSAFPLIYTVDYMRLYQTAGDKIYLPVATLEQLLNFSGGDVTADMNDLLAGGGLWN